VVSQLLADMATMTIATTTTTERMGITEIITVITTTTMMTTIITLKKQTETINSLRQLQAKRHWYSMAFVQVRMQPLSSTTSTVTITTYR
jgi:hypothetical protein